MTAEMWPIYVCSKGHEKPMQPPSGTFDTRWIVGRRCDKCKAKRDWTRVDVPPRPAGRPQPQKSNDITDLGRPLNPSRPTKTQVAAAGSLNPYRLREQTAAILQALLTAPMTDETIYRVLNDNGVSISVNGHRARRVELMDAGFVGDTGKTDTTTSGRQATLWGITASGRDALRRWDEKPIDNQRGT